MNKPKEPIDLCAVVQARLDQLPFLKPLSVEDVPPRQCPLVYEDNGDEDDEDAGRYSQGARLNEAVGIFLDWWGWGRPHSRYSFTVFEKTNGRWCRIQGRIEDLDEALATAIHTLAEHALLSTKAGA